MSPSTDPNPLLAWLDPARPTHPGHLTPAALLGVAALSLPWIADRTLSEVAQVRQLVGLLDPTTPSLEGGLLRPWLPWISLPQGLGALASLASLALLPLAWLIAKPGVGAPLAGLFAAAAGCAVYLSPHAPLTAGALSLGALLGMTQRLDPVPGLAASPIASRIACAFTALVAPLLGATLLLLALVAPRIPPDRGAVVLLATGSALGALLSPVPFPPPALPGSGSLGWLGLGLIGHFALHPESDDTPHPLRTRSLATFLALTAVALIADAQHPAHLPLPYLLVACAPALVSLATPDRHRALGWTLAMLWIAAAPITAPLQGAPWFPRATRPAQGSPLASPGSPLAHVHTTNPAHLDRPSLSLVTDGTLSVDEHRAGFHPIPLDLDHLIDGAHAARREAGLAPQATVHSTLTPDLIRWRQPVRAEPPAAILHPKTDAVWPHGPAPSTPVLAQTPLWTVHAPPTPPNAP